MAPSGFNTLLKRNVPHILETIFLSLDYESFKACQEVNNEWKRLLTSESFKMRTKILVCHWTEGCERGSLLAGFDTQEELVEVSISIHYIDG